MKKELTDFQKEYLRDLVEKPNADTWRIRVVRCPRVVKDSVNGIEVFEPNLLTYKFENGSEIEACIQPHTIDASQAAIMAHMGVPGNIFKNGGVFNENNNRRITNLKTGKMIGFHGGIGVSGTPNK